ncbi:hypothetical protein C8Q77DRAFT_1104102 [Trametes polyzona]|nr:hypothetical protein C8Q77DRAFT_1104102 [Trametes polyzona]
MKYFALLWFLWAICLQAVYGQTSDNHTDLVCTPFGTCEPCPEDALHEPFCQPFGNRRLMHCVPASSAPSPSKPRPPSVNPGPPPSSSPDSPQGETLGWESCGRIVQKERGDFYEFFACNLFIGIVAVTVVLARSKRLQALQARQLAARIGLVRGTPGGWTQG